MLRRRLSLPQIASLASAFPPTPSPPAALVPRRDLSSAGPPQGHWLDRFSGVQAWLEAATRRWWVRGLVQARCKEHHQLEGRELMLRASLEAEYARLMREHAGLAVDSRARQHLSAAALAAATHKVLLPFLRDEGEVVGIIAEHMGSRTAPALVWLDRLTAWLQRDAYAALTARLRGLRLDYGAGFDTELTEGRERSTLVVQSCLYRRFFEAVDAPQLAAACCCSQDRVWLEGAPRQGVAAGLETCAAAGDDACCFFVERRPPP